VAVRARAESLKAAVAEAAWPPVVQEYLDHLRVERGLAPNSLVAYGHELDRLARYAARRGKAVVALRQRDLSEFIGWLRERGLAARSVARAVHAVRGFYRFAVREGKLAVDPMENLKAPRAFRALPRYLSTAEVEALLAAPDVATAIGLRDRAML
jgi:integrase/recombinase XerD